MKTTQKQNGGKKATIYEVAQRAGVSVCTVSRVFNKHPYAQGAVNQRVLQASKELHYTPKFTTTGNCISILVEHARSFNKGAYENMVFTSAMARIVELGYSVEVVPLLDNDCGIRQFEFFSKGAVAITYTKTAEEAIQRIAIPVVAINNDIPGIHCVASNHRQGSAMAVDHLVRKGHSRIGILLSHNENWSAQERLTGYMSTLASHAIEYDEQLSCFCGGLTIFEATARLLRQKPTAIIAAGERYGLEASHALYVLGIQIPEAISLVGYEYAGVSEFLHPPQTTISQNLHALGGKAVDILHELINTTTTEPRRILLDNEILERESTTKLKTL